MVGNDEMSIYELKNSIRDTFESETEHIKDIPEYKYRRKIMERFLDVLDSTYSYLHLESDSSDDIYRSIAELWNSTAVFVRNLIIDNNTNSEAAEKEYILKCQELYPISISKGEYGPEVVFKYKLPHVTNSGIRTPMAYVSAIRISFGEALKGTPEFKTEKAVLIYEHHYKADSKDKKIKERDCDNYDIHHVTDLIAGQYVIGNDSPHSLKQFISCIQDNEDYTKVYVIPGSKFAKYICEHPLLW